MSHHTAYSGIRDPINCPANQPVHRIEEETVLPCGCTIEPDDTMMSSVYWNQYNEVVQCHKCGHVYEPVKHIDDLKWTPKRLVPHLGGLGPQNKTLANEINESIEIAYKRGQQDKSNVV